MDLVERVLLVAGQVPPGCVATYGDLAAVAGCGPRVAGRVLAQHGHAVAWWRIVNHAGALPERLADEAAARWRAEGIAVGPSGRCRLAGTRIDPADLLADYVAAGGPAPQLG